MCPLKVNLLSVTFYPEMAEIHWLIVTHPMKIQRFPSLPGFPHKGHWTQANQILPDVRGLNGLTIHRKNFGKIRPPPKKSPPAKVEIFGQHVFRDFLTLHHISPEWNAASTTKMLALINNVSPKSWPTFRDLWPRNGWVPFAHCDPPFGCHYVATIIVKRLS